MTKAMDMHALFLNYLQSTRKIPSDQLEDFVAFAEAHLPALREQCGLSPEADLYALTDEADWEPVNTQGVGKGDTSEEGLAHIAQLAKALKYYKGFLHEHKRKENKKRANALLRREQQAMRKERKAAASAAALAPNDAPPTDHSLPEAAGTVRAEGSVTQVCVTRYERNPKYRQAALAKYGYTCQVCGLNFEATYGPIGREFIEVHHLRPVSQMGDDETFHPLDEQSGLVPLCSNCHSMIHRGGHPTEIDGRPVVVPLTLDELRQLYEQHRSRR